MVNKSINYSKQVQYTIALALLLILSHIQGFAQKNKIELLYSFPTTINLFNDQYQSSKVKSTVINLIYYRKINSKKYNGFLWDTGLDFSILKLGTNFHDNVGSSNIYSIGSIDYAGICAGINYQLLLLNKDKSKIDMLLGINATKVIPYETELSIGSLVIDSSNTITAIHTDYYSDNDLRFTLNYSLNYILYLKERFGLSLGLKLRYDLNRMRKIDYQSLRNNSVIQRGSYNLQTFTFSMPVIIHF